MNGDNIFNKVNAGLRSAVKRIAMGEYVSTLSNTSPLLHEVNKKGRNIAFINCNIFDGIHNELKEGMTLLVEGEKILSVTESARAVIPDNYYLVDADGQTIMPGFIDNHVHQCSPFTYNANMAAVRQLPMQVALNSMQTVDGGVTTVCDMGGPQGILKEFTKLADRNCICGPRALNCFTLIAPKKGRKLGYPSQVKILNPLNAWLLEGQVATRPNTLKELKRACYKIKDDGGDHIKITYQHQPFSKKKYAIQTDFPFFDDDWMKSIFRIGKEVGFFVSIHSPYSADTEKCVDLAIEVGAKIRIQHMTFDKVLPTIVVKKMKDHGIFIIPTTMVFGDAFHLTELVTWLNKNPTRHMMPEANRQSREMIQNGIALEPLSGQVVMEVDYRYFREQFDIVKRNTQNAHDAGVIGFGTDTGGTYTGFFGRLSTEIMHYSEFGIPLFDILKYLTSVNAEICGLDDRGVIQPGKLADLVMVIGNPLVDHAALSEVSTVLKGGVFLKYKGRALSAIHDGGDDALGMRN